MASGHRARAGNDAGRIAAIVDAVSQAEITEFDAWNDLDVLSTRTNVDGISVDPAGVTVTGDRFNGLATIFVALQYGDGQGADGFETSDAFEGRFEGRFKDTKAVIEKLTVDTTPFYE